MHEWAVRRRRSLKSTASVIIAIALGLFAAQAGAQAYPAKPIRLLVGSAPGGNLDTVARGVAQGLTDALGRRVIVENRPGANAAIATEYVAKSAADGYTLLMAASTFTNAPSLVRNIPYDAVRDFTGVSLVATIPQMLVVHPSLPVKNVRELIVFARAQSSPLNYASSSLGSGSYTAMELFKRQAGLKMTRIGYNGDAPALVDLLGGHVPVKFDNFTTSIPHVKSGRLRALGVTNAKRSPLMPEVPAISETLPGYEASIYNGVMAPAATPKDIIGRLHGEIVKWVSIPEVRSQFAQQGVELQSSPTPEHFSGFIKSEVVRSAKMAQDAGIKPE
jgi:tripartite-type tricarboxylate transporter receptor subunit TctC